MMPAGLLPAFNGQLAVDTATQVVVGVDLTNRGSDLGEMTPMLEQILRRHERLPDEFLADGGFANHKEIEKGSSLGPVIYAPVSKPKDPTRERYEPMPGDSEAVADWRRRMGTEAAKEIYKDRAATVECVNAHVRNRGLLRFLVRGKRKARAVLLLHALAQNLMRAPALRSLALENA